MKIISWNVNGIRACVKKGFLDFLYENKPDILAVQETKAHPEQLTEDVLNPKGYKVYWSSAERKGYSGTALFIKQSIYDQFSLSDGVGIKKFDSEGRFAIAQTKRKIKDIPPFKLYNVYFPNGASSDERHFFKMDFLKKFLSHLKKEIELGINIILVGDYNIAHQEVDIHDPISNAEMSGFLPEERKWFDRFLKAGFYDSFRVCHPDQKDIYSWWSYRFFARENNKGWRIDYISLTQKLKKHLKKAEIWDDQMGSDHCPVLIELKVTKN